MRSLNCLVFGLAILAAGVQAGDKSQSPSVSISTADTVLAIYVVEGWVANPVGTQLVLAAWKDGRVIWSENRIAGGGPYRVGHVEPRKIEDLLARIGAEAYFDEPLLNGFRVPYDSGYSVLLAKSGKKVVMMQSAHETYPSDSELSVRPKVSAVSWTKATDKEDRYYLAWDQLRKSLMTIIPTRGEPIAGKLLGGWGEVSWQELSQPNK